jgi:hypothetical protein
MADEPDNTPDPLPDVHSLPRQVDPPAHAEARIVAALRHENLLASPRLGRSGPWLALAAGLLLFLAGWVLGNRSAQSLPQPSGPSFALLLYGDVSTPDGVNDPALVDEYRRWALSLREAGRVVSGERLDDDVRIVQTSSTGGPPERVRGFFLISATSLDEAEAVARTCPHYRRGGSVVVRPIG